MTGILLDRSTLDPGDLDLNPIWQTLPHWRDYPVTAATELAARIADARVVVTNKVVIDQAAMAAAPGLELIAVAATGYNNVDLEAARARGVAVCNVTGYATPSVVQHTFALLLTLVTDLDRSRQAVRSGRWAESPIFCLLEASTGELAGMTLGVIGYGELGRAVVAMARAFGMEVLIAQRPGQPAGAPAAGGEERVALDSLLERADVVTIHTPLADNTRGLIGHHRIARMKRGALLINTARGGIVDEQAVLDALRSGQLGGAAFDVLAAEPPAAGSPLLSVDLPNLLVTPHVAWASRPARQRLVNGVAANIAAHLAGGRRNRVV